MVAQGIVFYLFAIITVFAATMVIFSRNPVHSVLFLILAFFNSAGLFILIGAEFLAMILVVVYVGAVAVLFMFVVMMLDVSLAEMREGLLENLPLGAVVGFILVMELCFVAGGWVLAPDVSKYLFAPIKSVNLSNTEAIGNILYTHYIYYFQTAGLILLVAMIGAILLTHRSRPGVKKQNISDQLRRKPSDTIQIKKVKSGEGT
ncbi:MAG: NADH:ubiquinone oxidoreductase subunit J [Rhodospirillaceae bacterium]|nr:NADH:ubiquinone oxidoreductase subunit J [Rhodospirillaceae bacterium]OUT79809.1 MAG: NADH:ubiquinone oxidoreductase subunit J [Rhodospirillaceae bacterium TMED23]|tara:strand:- start:434 stop:1045 length:612 start_codon:yes stop_codon:yes gene_type:complete